MCLDPFANLILPFGKPIQDRRHWAGNGKNGQIILSDQPAHSIMFDAGGTPKTHANETTQLMNHGLSEIKQILHNWD